MSQRAAILDAAKEKAWNLGNLSWKLRPVQEQIYKICKQGQGLKTVINSSRRIGKTFTLCLLAIEHCLVNPDAQVRFACPTAKNLKKIILPIFRELLKDCPTPLRPRFNQVEGVFFFPNGAELHLAGCSNGNEENLRGQTATLCIVDEAGFVKALDYVVDDILMPQLLTTGGKLLMASTPPRTPAHAFQTYCMTAAENNAYAKFTIYESGYSDEVIAQFKKEAGGENSTTWKREYLAEFVVDADYAIVPEWQDRMLADAPTQHPHYNLWHKYEGLDIGHKDLTALLSGTYVFSEARLYIEDEGDLHGPAMTARSLADMVRVKREKNWGVGTKIYRSIADNNNPILLQDMGVEHDVHFSPTDKESLHAMVNKVREWVQADRVRISPKCVKLLGCLKYGVWDERRKEFDRSPFYGHFDHLAALVYLIRNIDENSNPVPVGYGADPLNTIIPRVRRMSDGAKALTNGFSLHKILQGKR